MLGPSPLSSLQTAGDNDKCLGRTAGPAEHLVHSRTGGLWTPSLLVGTGVTAQVLRRKEDRAGWTSVSGMDGLQLTNVESERCAKSGLALASGQRPTALLKHTET